MYEIEILMIDDNLADIQQAQETFNQNKLKNNLNIVSSGIDALAFLRREIPVPLPDLILLDDALWQNMGQGIFAAIKGDELLRDVPVLIMTPLGSEPVTYDPQVAPNGFVTKPFDFIQFINVVKTIQAFKVAIVSRY